MFKFRNRRGRQTEGERAEGHGAQGRLAVDQVRQEGLPSCPLFTLITLVQLNKVFCHFFFTLNDMEHIFSGISHS